MNQTGLKTRIIGLGNTILSDDGVGIYTVREVARRLAESGDGAKPDIVETEVAGFALMELMAGWDRVILVDCIQFDSLRAGAVVPIAPDDLRTSLKLRSVHEIDLPTVLKLGDRLGLAMPQEVRIFGIQAQDAWTFGESLSPAAARGMNRAADLILQQLGDCESLCAPPPSPWTGS
jgi:hydrogenase maturation protease